jgi:hypothetical protein
VLSKTFSSSESKRLLFVFPLEGSELGSPSAVLCLGG